MKRGFQSIGSVWLTPVDARRYAWVRVAFSLAVFLDVLHLWHYRIGLFSTGGALDAQAAADRNPGIYFSVFRWLETPASISAVFVATAVASLLLAAGVWTRAMVAVIVLFFISVAQRAPISLFGWDLILTNWGFILLFSPLGSSWGIGKLWKERKSGLGTGAEFSPRYGLVLIQIQVAILYWQAIGLRWGDAHWRDGEFLTYYFLSHHGRFGPDWVMGWDETLQMMTHLTILVEFSLPLALWISGTRAFGILLGVAFHLGIAIMSVNVTLFSLIMVLTYVAFLGGGKEFMGDRNARRET